MAKQAAVLMMVTVLATSHARPTTTPTPAARQGGDMSTTGSGARSSLTNERPHAFAAVESMVAPARHLLDKPPDAEVNPQLEVQMQLATRRHQNRRKEQGRQPGCQAAGWPARPAQVAAVTLPRVGAVRGGAVVTCKGTPVDVRRHLH